MYKIGSKFIDEKMPLISINIKITSFTNLDTEKQFLLSSSPQPISVMLLLLFPSVQLTPLSDYKDHRFIYLSINIITTLI